jgi:hypothetical protein
MKLLLVSKKGVPLCPCLKEGLLLEFLYYDYIIIALPDANW